MSRFSFLIISAALGLGACATTKAAGTNPSDMTAAEHRNACLKHKRIAATFDERAKNLGPGKARYIAKHERDEHADVARQHGEASKVVDPRIGECE